MKWQLFFSLIFVASLNLVAVFAQGESLDLKDCRDRGSHPEAMRAVQDADGAYKFEYQSQIGNHSSGSQCRAYILRNTPGKPATEVLWFDDQELFVQVTLPRCGSESKCDALIVERYCLGDGEVRETFFNYGSYWRYDSSEQAFASVPAEAFNRESSRAAQCYDDVPTAFIHGAVAGDDGYPFEVALTIYSNVILRDGVPTAVYKIDATGLDLYFKAFPELTTSTAENADLIVESGALNAWLKAEVSPAKFDNLSDPSYANFGFATAELEEITVSDEYFSIYRRSEGKEELVLSLTLPAVVLLE